ncbi:MAG: hypothetical protein KDA25_06290 [Phycisphaerales bacterium]|nr:hypothetical protein [Phycisphaerales bacterium]
MPVITGRTVPAILALLLPAPFVGVTLATAAEAPSDPIANVLMEADEDVRLYNDHLTTLASPFMEGRLPGTRGMEIASDYVEFYFEAYGLAPAFPAKGDTGERTSYRQPFPLAAPPPRASRSPVCS